MRVSLAVTLTISVAACAPVADEPVALFSRLEAAAAAERDRIVRDAIASNEGTPIIEGDTAHFFVEAPDEGVAHRCIRAVVCSLSI